MSRLQVLLVAGTHGNEINAPWLFDQWSRNVDLVNTSSLEVIKIVGNPKALDLRERYLNRDLNRSFRSDLLGTAIGCDYEVERAKEIMALHGESGSSPCQIAIDFHSTTANMGSSLVIYGRRACDLAIASLIQFHLGLPVYLHEMDSSQTGFLVENWPCGLVVEIGPVAQNLLDIRIVQKTKLVLEACLQEVSKVLYGQAHFPPSLIVHRHIKSIDFPRDVDDIPIGCLHEEVQGNDWKPLKTGSPLFSSLTGYLEHLDEREEVVPVFINEAAYAEKKIAMSLTKREVLPVQENWKEELKQLVQN